MTNEVLKTIKSRRSVRAYKADAVPPELLRAVCEAGTYAPTGRGQQSPTIVAVTTEKYRRELRAGEYDACRRFAGARVGLGSQRTRDFRQ